MRYVNDVIYELLVEIDDICKENNIKYSLEGEVVRDAYCINNLGKNIIEADISMDTENIIKFYEVMKNFEKEGRIFESVLNTKRKRTFMARYLKTDTCYMDLRRTKKVVNKFMGINIHLRLNRYDNPNKLKAQKLQIAWKCGANKEMVLYKNFLRCLSMKCARLFLGEIRVGKCVWKKWIKYNKHKICYDNYNNYLKYNKIKPKDIVKIMREELCRKQDRDEVTENNTEYAIIRRELPMVVVQKKEIPAFLYDNLAEITIRERKFLVPKETDLYLWFRFDINKGFSEDFNEINGNIMVSEKFSCNEFEKKYADYFEKNKKMSKELQRHRIKRGIIMQPILKMYNEFEKVFFNIEENN